MGFQWPPNYKKISIYPGYELKIPKKWGAVKIKAAKIMTEAATYVRFHDFAKEDLQIRRR